MPLPLIEFGRCDVDLNPSPIEPSWIIEGNPEARAQRLSVSADGATTTVIWSCTEGKFNWYYDIDETIMILEGSIVLESEGMPPKRYGVGDVILFRGGAHAKWHVEGFVKKVAFLRRTNPIGFIFAIRAVNKLKRMFVGAPAARVLRFWFSYHLHNGVNRVYLEGSWLDGLYPSLEV
jgi:uncharacterized cupin superfamily protein